MNRFSRMYRHIQTAMLSALMIVGPLLLPAPAHAAPPEPYLFKDIDEGASSSWSCYFAQVGDSLFFRANNQLWVTDGTPGGTRMVKDIVPWSLTAMNGTLFFSADDGTHGSELWRSDGTEAGTTMVKDIYPGGGDAYPALFAVMNGTLFFGAIDGIHGKELWASDGTEAGTYMVKDIYPGGSSAYPSSLTVMNDTLFFHADDGTHGEELWRSDGTEAGTYMVKDIYPGGSNSNPSGFIAMNGTLFFSVDDGTHGSELWRSDGTEAGTYMVKDIYPGGGDAYPGYFTAMNGILFFSADDGTHGKELWASDGTEAGTTMIKDANPGTDPGLHYLLASINGTLFLVATEGVHGLELWASDGTEAGTMMIKDIKPGGAGSFGTFTSWPENFIAANGTLFFTTTDDVHGNELWASDGTPEGTTMVKDIHPSDGSWPRNLTNFGDALFFTADDGSHGDELWTLTVQDLHLSKSVTPTAGVAYHGPITYTLALRNAAWGTENAAQVVDALPDEVDFGDWVEQPGGATAADNEIRWNGAVTAGGTITLTFTALHTGSSGDVVTNTAHFTGSARVGSAGAMFTVVNQTPVSKVYMPLIYKFD